MHSKVSEIENQSATGPASSPIYPDDFLADCAVDSFGAQLHAVAPASRLCSRSQGCLDFVQRQSH